MFIVSESKEFNHSPVVIVNSLEASDDSTKLSYLKIMARITSQKPITKYGDFWGYKKAIKKTVFFGCKYISRIEDRVHRKLPMFFCLQDDEKINQLDQGIQTIGKMGYLLSEQEISEIKKLLIAARKKYTFSFVISLIIQKIISFFRGE